MCDWVRVIIVGPDKKPATRWDLEDGWYAAGQYRHPDQRQQARDELAAAELGDWLDRWRPAPGEYVIWVAELDSATGQASQTWARTRLDYR